MNSLSLTTVSLWQWICWKGEFFNVKFCEFLWTVRPEKSIHWINNQWPNSCLCPTICTIISIYLYFQRRQNHILIVIRFVCTYSLFIGTISTQRWLIWGGDEVHTTQTHLTIIRPYVYNIKILIMVMFSMATHGLAENRLTNECVHMLIAFEEQIRYKPIDDLSFFHSSTKHSWLQW